MEKIKNRLTLFLKLSPFALQAKTNIILFSLFLILGAVIDIISLGKTYFGMYLFALTPVYISQLLNSVSLASFSESSPKKREMLLDTPCALNLFTSSALYLFIVITRLCFSALSLLSKEALISLLYFDLILFFMTFYNLFVFRKPVLGYSLLAVFIFFISFTGGFSFYEGAYHNRIYMMIFSSRIFDNPVICYLLFYIPVLINAFIFYLLSSLLYKEPISEKVYKSAFKRAERS